MKKLFAVMLAVVVLFLPMLVLAQGTTSGGAGAREVNNTYIDSLLGAVYRVVNSIIPIVVGIGVIMFLWSAFKLFKDPGKAENRTALLNSVIFLAVAVSVWGIIGLLQSVFGVTNTNPEDVKLPNLPKVNPATR